MHFLALSLASGPTIITIIYYYTLLLYNKNINNNILYVTYYKQRRHRHLFSFFLQARTSKIFIVSVQKNLFSICVLVSIYSNNNYYYYIIQNCIEKQSIGCKYNLNYHNFYQEQHNNT